MLKRTRTAMTSIVIIISLITSVSAFPYDPFGSLLYHQTNDQGINNGDFTPRLECEAYNVYYYISTSYLFSPYASYARTGAENWDSSSDIDLEETSSYWSSNCDIKGYDGNLSLDDDLKTLNGYAIVWVGDGPGASNNVSYNNPALIPSDYFAGEVYLNYAKLPSSDYTKIRAVTSHEVGHVLGLGHASSYSRIMYHFYSYLTVFVPQSTEKLAVVNLYAYR